MLLRAWYVPPGLEPGPETTVQRFGPPHDAVELEIPAVTPADLARWIEGLVAARRERLAARPTRSVARALERVARRFLAADDPVRREAIHGLARTGRFDPRAVAHALDHAFGPLTRGGIERWLRAELGSADALDRLVSRRDGPPRRAHGPEWMLQVYAGNVPAIPVWPLWGALLLKSAVLAKTASREPLLAPLLARAIAEEDPDLGACVAAVWWKGGAEELDRAALSRAPALLAFGGAAATGALARAARPDAIVVLHGARVSVSCVAREALTAARYEDLARRAAADIALYDQQGCLSPHAIYVEWGGRLSPGDFASALGEALAAEAGAAAGARASVPGEAGGAAAPGPPAVAPGPPAVAPGPHVPVAEADPEEAASVQLYRAQAAFEAAQGERGTRLLGSPGASGWTVVVEEGARFEPTPAHRTVRVHAVADLGEACAALGPLASYIESVGLEAPGPRAAPAAAAIAALGIPRIARIGRLQEPSPLAAHGGVGYLAPLVRWTSVDAGRDAGAPRRAPPARGGRPTGRPVSRPSARGSRRAARGSRR